MLARLRKLMGQIRYLKRPSQIIRYFTCKIKSLEIAVTYRCNQKCPGCYAEDLMTTKDVLDKDKILQIVKEYKPFHINITGGEPLLREDILDIISSIPKSVVISLVTNGRLLTEEKLRKLKEAGLNTLQLSYGKNYTNNLDVVKSPAAKGLNICLSVTNTKENKEYIEDAIKQARLNNWHVLYNLPSGILVKNFDKETYLKHRNDSVIREDNMFWSGWNTCPAGTNKAYITAKGQLMPCDRLHEIYPDLKTMRKNFKHKAYCNRLTDLN